MTCQRIVFEDAGWTDLLPLVYWRSVGELRCGRRTLLEQHLAAAVAGCLTGGASITGSLLGLWVRPELAAVVAERFPAVPVNASWVSRPAPPASPEAQILLINARWLADANALPSPEGPAAVGVCDGQVAYLRLPAAKCAERSPEKMLAADAPSADDWAKLLGRREPAGGAMVRYPWHLVKHNVSRMLEDWRLFSSPSLATDSGNNCKIYEGVHLLERTNIHVGAGSSIKPCTVLDAEDGPIWIGQNVRISPNCTIQGPVVIGDGTLVQPGSVIREGTTIGPVCKVGGEIEGSILWGFSNKQHDGFLGHACLGSWINIAADSVNSDLKNTYGPIRVPINGTEIDSGEMFVGLTMGDHSKSSINSSFATGTVVGFCSNVICNLFPPKFVPSFCWLTDDCRKVYDPAKGLAVAKTVMARRKVTMTAAEEALFLAAANLCRRIEVTDQLGPAEA